MSLTDKLRKFLEDGKDWERKATTVRGVFLLKLPSSSSWPAGIAVEINPVDSAGQPTKKRGLIIRSISDLDSYKSILAEPKLEELMKAVEEVNPKARRPAARRGEEPVEI